MRSQGRESQLLCKFGNSPCVVGSVIRMRCLVDGNCMNQLSDFKGFRITLIGSGVVDSHIGCTRNLLDKLQGLCVGDLDNSSCLCSKLLFILLVHQGHGL